MIGDKLFLLAARLLDGGENHTILARTDETAIVETTYPERPWMMRHVVRTLTSTDIAAAWDVAEVRYAARAGRA